MRGKGKQMTVRGRAWCALIAILLSASGSASVAQQNVARERFTPAPTRGKITTQVLPRALDVTPVLVVAVLGGESVADAQERAGRKLSRDEKNAIKARRRAEQNGPRAAIEAAGGRVVGSFQSALNGIKVRIPQNRVAVLRQLAGVVDVKAIKTFTHENFLGVQRIQAPFAWAGALGVRGENTKIAIIDTGVDYTHATFGGPGTPAAFEAAFATSTTPADPALFGPDAPKVKGGTDLAGDDYDANVDTSVPVPDPNPLDCNGHGTHVAGTAAGFGVLVDGTTFHGAYDQLTHTNAFAVGPGVAPRADIYAVRVFGCEGSTNLVTDALEWAVDNDMDVVNMSLGSSFGDADDASAEASDNAVKAGIVVVASAGNSGNIEYVTGSPGSSSRAISVAGTPSSEFIRTVNFALPSGTITGINANGAAWTSPQALSVHVLRTPTGAVSLGCDTAEYLAQGVAGKLVVVSRGVCARVAKAIFGQQAGAAAVVMINNVNALPPFEGPITFNPDTGESFAVTIPFFGIRGAASPDDNRLVASDGLTITFTEGTPIQTGTASFSSAGPRNGDSFLKPDISAPGEAIVSSLIGSGNAGVIFSGTSMASPHVAGVAALVRQAHPTWKPAAIKAAIINSGNPGGLADYVTRRNGSGVVNAASATGTSVYAFADQQRTSLSFGLEEFKSSVQRTRPIHVKNTGQTAITFDVTVAGQGSPHTAELDASQVTVFPHSQLEVALTLTVPGETAGNVDAFRDVAGVVTFTPTTSTANRGIALRVPYYLVPRVSANVAATLPRLKGSPPTATATVTNKDSAIAAQTDFYAWGLESPNEGLGKTDLRAAGAQVFDIGVPVVSFAVNTYKPWSSAFTVEFDIFVEVNGDGVDDFVIFNVDLGLLITGVRDGQHAAVILDLSTGDLFADFLVTAPTDSATMVLPVLAETLGISSGNPRLSYRVVAFDLESDNVDSFFTYAGFNAFTPAISNGAYEVVGPDGTLSVPISVDPAEFAITPAKGVMIVAPDNKNGAREAELLRVRY